MKIKILLTSFFVVSTLASLLLAEEPKKIIEPEYQNVVFYLDTTSTNLIPLERQKPSVRVRVKALGYAGSEKIMEIKGEKSPNRFTAGQTLEFIVRVSSQQTDPQSYIDFFKLESKNGNRQIVLAKAGTMGINGRSTTKDASVAFDAAKYGGASFKFRAAVELPPGEYEVSTIHAKDAFCFGVDPKSSKDSDPAKEKEKNNDKKKQ